MCSSPSILGTSSLLVSSRFCSFCCTRYPFLLPNLAVALLAIVSVPFVMYVLPETMVRPDARVEQVAEDKRCSDLLVWFSVLTVVTLGPCLISYKYFCSRLVQVFSLLFAC